MKICFFCKISRPKLLETIEFYKQDIDILKKIDPNLKIATCFSEIDWSCDIIFIWWWTYAFIPCLLSKIKRKKTIITGTFNYRCNGAKKDYFHRPFWQRWIIKSATKLSNANIFVSKNEYEEITSDFKLQNSRYIPHGVDIDRYKPNTSHRENNFLFSLTWLNKDNVIRKCLLEIIKAIAIVRINHPNVILKIAGHNGDASKEVLELIKELKLESNVELLGEISFEEKLYYLQNCQYYVMPSRFEGFGLGHAEAMACGATIITSRMGELPNVIGNCGFYVNNNPEDIAKNIEFLLSHPTYKGEEAVKRIKELFPVTRREKELKSLLEIITNG